MFTVIACFLTVSFYPLVVSRPPVRPVLKSAQDFFKEKIIELTEQREQTNYLTQQNQQYIKKQRVLVTGLGIVSPVGIGVDEFWNNLLNGYNPCDIVESLPDTYSCRVACRVDDAKFKAAEWYMNPMEVKRNDRYGHFAMAGAKMAIQDAHLNTTTDVIPERFGVLISSAVGGIEWTQTELTKFLQKGPRTVSPYLIPAMIANVSPGAIAIETNAMGPNFGVVSACATGTHSIGESFKMVQRGEVDVMLAGGSEATLTDFVINGFNQLTATAKGWNDQPKRASRPFDSKRSGFVMGEGAGVLILESEEHALRRGAKIYGEMAGYAASCDANHITAPRPDGKGLVIAIEKSIAEAGIAKTDIGHVNAHGTSTPLNDKTETLSLKTVFGDHAKNLLISSTKSQTGHCLGAAGGIEAVAAVKALETGIAPPTLNLDYPDPQCDLFYCPHKKVVKEGGFEAVLSTSLGFGGQNAALVFKKYRRN